MIIFLLSVLIPPYTQRVSAILILEEPTLPDVKNTWSPISLVYDNQYHNTSALWEEITIFDEAAGDLIEVDIMGSSHFGQDIKSVRITNELRTHQKAKTLVVANHHGREQISVEVALRFILDLLNNYGVDDFITEAINTQEIYVIPTINPDALDRVVNEHDYWLRKNARPFDDDGDGLSDEDPYEDIDGDGIVSAFVFYEKINGSENLLYYNWEGNDNDGDGLINEDLVGHIDLNRNYDMFFRNGTAWSDNSLVGNYPGVSAFSEPEIQVYRDFALDHRFAMAYSLHSGTNATYFAKTSLDYFERDLCEAMIPDFESFLPSSFHFNDRFPGDPNVGPIYAAGIWDNWMYFERKTLMPISLELYGNGTAADPAIEIPIFENSTHIIKEWKEIEWFYNPKPQNINSHWKVVKPYFPYLLENTPRLKADATLLSQGDSPGSLVNMSFVYTNLSPKLRSIATVNLYEEVTGNKIAEGEEIPANSTTQLDVTFLLPSSFTDSYEIKFGNEFVGYYHYIISKKTELASSIPSPIPFSILGVVLALIGTGFYILTSSRRNNRSISSGW